MNQKTAKLINKVVRRSVLADPRIKEEDKDRATKSLARRVRGHYEATPRNLRHKFKQELRISVS